MRTKVNNIKPKNKGQNKMKHTKDNNFYLTRFQECVKFLTQRNIIKFINEDNLKSFDDYKKQSAARKAYYLNINSEIISNLTRCNKTHYLNDFLEKSKDIFTYHRHYHKKYKSGKQFSRNSWFELLNESDIKICFDNPSFIHTNNKEILSKESHEFIDKIYLVYSKKLKKNEDKENEDMTKKEEQAIDKKYAEGKGTYINAETEKKMIRKQEQQKTKREKNRIRKICKQTMVEEQMLIEKLTQENKELKAHIEYLEKLVVKNSDIPVEEEKHLIEYDELDKYFPDGLEQSDLDRLSDNCKQKIKEKAEKERIEFEKNNIENCSAEKIHTEIVNAEKLLANWENEMKDFKEESEEIVEEKHVEKPIKKPVEEKPDNKNSDIPSCIEDRFQEFINKKYIGPAEATTLWCGLNEYAAHNPPKFKGNGYILCDRNTIKNKKGYTPQQIIAVHIINQMQQQHIEIKDEKLKARFYETLNNMVA